MTIKLTATACTMNGHTADWKRDAKTISAMMKAKLGLV